MHFEQFLEQLKKDQNFNEVILSKVQDIFKREMQFLFYEKHQIHSRRNRDIIWKDYFSRIQSSCEYWKNHGQHEPKGRIRNYNEYIRDQERFLSLVDKYLEIENLIEINDYKISILVSLYEGFYESYFYYSISKYDILECFELEETNSYGYDDGKHDVEHFLYSYWSHEFNLGYIKNEYFGSPKFKSFIDSYMFFDDLNEMEKEFKKHSINPRD